MNSSIHLLLAEDHCVVRAGLKRLLCHEADIQVVADVPTGNEILAVLQNTPERRYDLLLTDMNMPGVNGHDLIARVRALRPALPILVLSMHTDPQFIRTALEAGAKGYVSKEAAPETLIAAVRKVAAGNSFIPPELAEQLVFDDTISQGPPHAALSQRELQIFKLLALGTSINHVADCLGISNKTVSTHKARLMGKLGFANNADLVRYAIQYRLVG